MVRDLTFRCSSVGKLMGEPRTKGAVLSDTAKSYVRELAAQAILGVDFEISGKPIEKGIEVEPAVITLINRVRGLSLAKNTERRTDDYLTGECDLIDAVTQIGRDAKAAWSAQTFPIVWEDITDAQRRLYEWQCRAYMRLWDAGAWWIEYGLVDTPERLIGFEPLPIHVVSHIPEHLRLTGQCFTRDMALEAAMLEKIKAARAYYRDVITEFDRTHQAVKSREWCDEGAEAFPPEPPPETIDRGHALTQYEVEARPAIALAAPAF